MTNIFEDILNDRDFDTLNNLVRWNGTRRIKEETVAHHSFLVTWFTRILVENLMKGSDHMQKLAVIDLAMFHDFPEMFDFDVNHTVKYNEHNGEGIRELLRKFTNERTLEKFSKSNVTHSLFRKNLIQDEIPKPYKMIVKICDWLSCVFYVNKEIKLGNTGLQDRYQLSIMKLHDVCDKFTEEYSKVYDMEIVRKIRNSNYTIK